MNISDLIKINYDDLATLSSKDLLDFQLKINKAIEKKQLQEKTKVFEKINTLANEAGFSLKELKDFLKNPPKKTVSVKYRNPMNSSETWAGRGRKPKWLITSLATGKKLSDFEV